MPAPRVSVVSWFSADARLRNLDRLRLTLLLTGALIAVGLYSAGNAEYSYGDPRYVAGLLRGEAITAAYLFLITVLFFPADRLGLRLPRNIHFGQLSPLLILLLTTFSCWLATRLSLPDTAQTDGQLPLRILAAAVLVGVNEEWIFRGLLLAALCRRCGLRNGGIIALFLFGLAHAGNALAGENFAYSLLQVVSTMLVGSLLLLAAIASRSLVVPMSAHGFYDFLVVDIGRLGSGGANKLFMLPMIAAGIVLGAYGVYRTFQLKGLEPFAPESN